MLLNLISFFTGRKIIWLKDFEGEYYRTIVAKGSGRNPFDCGPYCYVRPLFKIGFVTLLPEGKTGGISYIKQWREEGT